MVIIIVLLGLALLTLVVAFALFWGLPDSRISSGRNVKWALLICGLFIVCALGVALTIKVQEKTGVTTGLSGGVSSDARQWIARNQNQPPAADQPGDNIKILRDGMAFLRSHPTISSSPDAQALMQRYSQLPERPTRLLSRQEEGQYYEGAQAVWRIINSAAGSAE